jgi:hypothetical protein
MNQFQSIESGQGFLKKDYDPNKVNMASEWLKERLKKKEQKIEDRGIGSK